jgi:hypothetical protein
VAAAAAAAAAIEKKSRGRQLVFGRQRQHLSAVQFRSTPQIWVCNNIYYSIADVPSFYTRSSIGKTRLLKGKKKAAGTLSSESLCGRLSGRQLRARFTNAHMT